MTAPGNHDPNPRPRLTSPGSGRGRSLDNASLEHLLRLAGEADELERSASGVPAQPAIIGRVAAHAGEQRVPRDLRQRRLLAASGIAAAFLVGLLGVWALGFLSPAAPSTPVASNTPTPRPAAPSIIPTAPASTPVLASTPAQLVSLPHGSPQTFILAIYQDPYTGKRCVQWQPAEFVANRCLKDVPGQELRNIRFQRPCATGPHAITLVAISSASTLLINDANAAQIADCILSGEHSCDGSGSCVTPAATRCVPPHTSVRVETVAF